MNSMRHNDDNRQKINHDKRSAPSVPAVEDLQKIVEASRLIREGQSRQAEQLLLPLLTKKRAPVGAVDLLAKLYSRRGQVQEAAALWRWALELDPGNRMYQQALADCEQRQKAGKGPARFFYPTAVIGLIVLFIAGCWWYLGRPVTWQAVAEHQTIAAWTRTLQGLPDHSSSNQPSTQPGAASLPLDQLAAAPLAQAEAAETPAQGQAPGEQSNLVSSSPSAAIPRDQAERPSLFAVSAVHQTESPKAPVLTDAMAPAKTRLVIQTLRGLLHQDDLLRALPIEISANGNTVSLSGEVPTFYLRYHLEKTVTAVAGVSGVTLQDVKVTHRYTVREGDTLSTIARQTGGSTALTAALSEANRLSYPYQLSIGDVLVLPF